MQTKKEYQLIYVAIDLQVKNSHNFLITLFLAMWKEDILTITATSFRDLETLNMMDIFIRVMMLTMNLWMMKFRMDMETLNMSNSDIYKEIIWKMPETIACRIRKNSFSF